MTQKSGIKVWDPLVRVFHWTLVVAFFTAYLTEGEVMPLHAYAGYLIAALVAVRLIWGFIGSEHARFRDFVRGPRAVLGYLGELRRGREPRYVGHNPAGGVMIVLLLISLIVTSVLGLVVYGAEEGAGPLAGWLAGAEGLGHTAEEVHGFFANFTLVLVGLHVAGVALESLRHRENLVRAMITGYKQRREV